MLFDVFNYDTTMMREHQLMREHQRSFAITDADGIENCFSHTTQGTCGLSTEFTKRKRKCGNGGSHSNKENIGSSHLNRWQSPPFKKVMEDSSTLHSPLSPLNENIINNATPGTFEPASDLAKKKRKSPYRHIYANADKDNIGLSKEQNSTSHRRPNRKPVSTDDTPVSTLCDIFNSSCRESTNAKTYLKDILEVPSAVALDFEMKDSTDESLHSMEEAEFCRVTNVLDDHDESDIYEHDETPETEDCFLFQNLREAYSRKIPVGTTHWDLPMSSVRNAKLGCGRRSVQTSTTKKVYPYLLCAVLMVTLGSLRRNRLHHICGSFLMTKKRDLNSIHSCIQ
ncbi:hypothetical protein DCAR_0313793 [Daucus carota subsp. sativus]|uniref:Uncharacterized protein n=1 Tax=Daucus carota subsp. sativus TaxID=79200 RepID=A0AAF0WRM6_DAUCS|nr:PREDICTED: uncharacterized protein LOC108214947 [Daucus carota subsp. sativus]XP_017242704.1 PREDICTED: uncharacterized protein LOC108214947 [Daucus carota subsp. sativus]XP_017242705.1 PREDICTED: uncharacterized protein LOC108214947 [Daucus carota subsp. sativus]XP_017242706.1 PREDICTED: uncharacterized protein LOC108214947 [Daucus carota subsp. sativus]XP_017242707.1 PREDICTED: uncharacterized protein LOC108214947 [Daucus carota subsp. sativus]XP_017242708.1 PREDICTED: uncharacterized pro